MPPSLPSSARPERMRKRVGSPPGAGSVKTSVSGWAKHACFYEFTSLEARNTHFVHYEQSHPEMEAWSKRVVRNTIHAPGSANVAQRIRLEVK